MLSNYLRLKGTLNKLEARFICLNDSGPMDYSYLVSFSRRGGCNFFHKHDTHDVLNDPDKSSSNCLFNGDIVCHICKASFFQYFPDIINWKAMVIAGAICAEALCKYKKLCVNFYFNAIQSLRALGVKKQNFPHP